MSEVDTLLLHEKLDGIAKQLAEVIERLDALKVHLSNGTKDEEE